MRKSLGGRALGRRRRGQALFLVMGAILVVFLLVFGMMNLVQSEGRLTTNLMDGLVAFYLAEAGVEQAVYTLKRTAGSDERFVDALIAARPYDFAFEPATPGELAALAPAGRGEVRLTARYEPDEEPTFADARVGRLVVRSCGVYHTPLGYKAMRQIKVALKVTAVNLGIVAPEHGLFNRDPRAQVYQVPGFTLDARDFEVMGGNVFLSGGMRCELTESLILKEFRPMGELGILDLGYDSWNLASLLSGGVNFTHSPLIEYEHVNNPVTRKYFNFEGLGALLGPGAAWKPVEEPYMPGRTRQATRMYTDESINLLKADQYKKLATTVVDPRTSTNPAGDARDSGLFQNVTFAGPLGARSNTYSNVLPLYGWGDWRNVPAAFFRNPTRRDDLSNALSFDGITYVRGDVFLEGWYQGLGTLVVQGNVYVGGDVIGLPPPTTGFQSLMNLVVLEDPNRESTGQNRWTRTTGKVVYDPHHDQDWDRLNLSLMRNTKPNLDIAIYAQNGLETDRSSVFNKFFNMSIEFNYVSEIFDWQKLPNDLRINGTDPQVVLQQEGRDPLRAFLHPVFGTEYLRWEEEQASI